MKKRIPYGVGNFETIMVHDMYYVDKTRIIPKLENYQYPFLIRPRRFGKSLLISLLENYYDIEKTEEFDKLFKNLWISSNPTIEKNSFLTLRFDFSGIETSKGKELLYESFTNKIKNQIFYFINKFNKYIDQKIVRRIEPLKDPSTIIDTLTSAVKESKKRIYLLIDEYDNFANDLISSNDDQTYYEIISKTGFVRTFYESIKTGAQEGAIWRIFMTGVSPIMLDDLTSGFNIARNITLDKSFNESLGFTQEEVKEMTEYYNVLSEEKKEKALQDMKIFYNGYLFSEDAKERLYNPDMVLHFMDSYKEGEYPKLMVDMNVKTDYGKIQRLINEDRYKNKSSKIDEILEKEEISTKLIQMFPLEAITNKDELISLMFYMGLLTIKESIYANVKLKVPNLVIKELYWEYIYTKVNHELDQTLDIGTITEKIQKMAQTGNPEEFIKFAYEKTREYLSNRDLIQMDEKSIKMILLSFLTMNSVYIPYSEIEMNGGYSDLVLIPDTRYKVNNAQIWELKYIKKNENKEEKIEQAKQQIKKYEQDIKFIRQTKGIKVYKYIILATKEKIEIQNY